VQGTNRTGGRNRTHWSFRAIRGFGLKVDEMTKRLRMLNEAINQKLKPWSVKVDDKSIIDYGRWITRLMLVFVVLTTYIGWKYSKATNMDHPKKPVTAAPGKP
jgi:hypothetical protein